MTGQIGCTLLVAEHRLHNDVRRATCVTFTPGRSPRIDLERRRACGERLGVLQLHRDVQPELARALDAAKEGRRYRGEIPIRGERIMRFVALERDTLQIAIVNTEGIAQGAASVLRGDELETLREAMAIAQHEACR
jgi:hypothetical protein